MDADRFDALTRALTAAGSRRRAVALAVSGMLAPLLSVAETDARKSLKKCKKIDNKKKRKKCIKKAKKPTCTDRKKNGRESDVDCGGGDCPRCAIGQVCVGGNDGASARCVGSTCQACINNGDCGPDSNGTNTCACRDHESGQKFCTKQDGRFFPAGTSCGNCEGDEQCFLILGGAGGIECVRPCGAV
jgi:hypothetical protein